MADIDGQSSDLVKKVENQYLGYNIYSGIVTMPNPLDITYAVGFGAFVEVPVSELNFGTQVPEVSAVMYKETALGGGITQYSHKTLPFSIPLYTANGVSESAHLDVYYQAQFKTNPLDATSKLVIWYYNQSSSVGGQIFYYKIKAANSLPE